MPEPTTIEKPDLKNVIASAVESVSKEGTEETNKPAEDTKVVEDKKSEEPTDEEKAELVEAQKLYAALKNPETRGSVIEFIAKQAGYTKPGELETKKDVKEATKGLIDELKEGLGEQFEFLADKIGPAIEKFLDKKRQEDLQDIRASLEAQEREKLEAQSARAISKLTETFFGEGEELPADVQKEMSKFMDKVPPSADLSVKDYVELAFNAAVGKLGLSKTDKSKKEKIEKNRSDAASRLASDRSGSRTAQPVPDTSKTMTRKEAIQAAIEAANKE